MFCQSLQHPLYCLNLPKLKQKQRSLVILDVYGLHSWDKKFLRGIWGYPLGSWTGSINYGNRHRCLQLAPRHSAHTTLGSMTFSIMTFSIMTFSTMTFSTMWHSNIMLSVIVLSVSFYLLLCWMSLWWMTWHPCNHFWGKIGEKRAGKGSRIKSETCTTN